jgi:hypothetical protein
MAELVALSIALPLQLDEVQFVYRADPRAHKLLAQCTMASPEGSNELSMEDGILKLHGHI